jgi:D-cysteine desulfhydrase
LDTIVYIKRDDISAPLFGGNKVRALEFLLGAAQHRQISRAIVAGLPGTSMALASAFYGKQQQLNLAVVLIAQQPTEEAKRNLLIFGSLGRNYIRRGQFPLYHCGSRALCWVDCLLTKNYPL